MLKSVFIFIISIDGWQRLGLDLDLVQKTLVCVVLMTVLVNQQPNHTAGLQEHTHAQIHASTAHPKEAS